METLIPIFLYIDPVLIFPYRVFENPILGWLAGTFCLCLWALFLGEITMAVAGRINREPISQNMDDTVYYHEQSMKAKAAGDETAYKGINKLANEAYGKSFFLMMAMSMATLWPAFFAAAWLELRFYDLQFPLPAWAMGINLSFIAPFIIFYILQRIALAKLKKIVPSILKRFQNRQTDMPMPNNIKQI